MGCRLVQECVCVFLNVSSELFKFLIFLSKECVNDDVFVVIELQLNIYLLPTVQFQYHFYLLIQAKTAVGIY